MNLLSNDHTETSSDVHNRVGILHIRMWSIVQTKVGKMCSDVQTKVRTLHMKGEETAQNSKMFEKNKGGQHRTFKLRVSSQIFNQGWGYCIFHLRVSDQMFKLGRGTRRRLKMYNSTKMMGQVVGLVAGWPGYY